MRLAECLASHSQPLPNSYWYSDQVVTFYMQKKIVFDPFVRPTLLNGFHSFANHVLKLSWSVEAPVDTCSFFFKACAFNDSKVASSTTKWPSLRHATYKWRGTELKQNLCYMSDWMADSKNPPAECPHETHDLPVVFTPNFDSWHHQKTRVSSL